MKVRLFLSALLLVGGTAICSAEFNYGVRVGVSTVGDIKVNNPADATQYTFDYAKGEPGFHFGGVAKLQIASFFVQPELLFAVSRADVQIKDWPGQLSEVTGKQSFRKIDVPVMAGMKFGPLKVQAGPVATMKLNTKIDLQGDYELEQTYKGATFGYQAGLGLELANLILDVKYEGSLSKFGTGATFGDTEIAFDQRMSQWVLSLGFFLD